MLLNGKQKRYLRSLAVNVKASVIIGKEGLTDTVYLTLNNSLKAHELVKVQILKACDLPLTQIALDLSSHTNSAIVQTIGHNIVLYKPGKEAIIKLP